MIAKQQAKRGQAYPMYLYAMEKHEKVESINTKNEYKTMSEK